MAAQGSVQDSFTFVGGLHTEGSFFLTPKDCWKDGDNVIPQTDGSIERRNAIQYESNYITRTLTPNAQSTLDSVAYSVHKWRGVGGNGNLDFFIVQIGKKLYFYNALGGAISQRSINYSIDLTTYQASGNLDVVDNVIIQTAVINGDLLVASQATKTFVVSYNPTNSSFSVRAFEQQIRDFKGIYMNGVDPTTENTEATWDSLGLKAAALYNLYNQGWNQTQINTYKTAYSNKLPANTKSWIYGKDANDDFSATVLNKQEFGTSLATKGRVIFDAFNQLRSGLGTSSEAASTPSYQDNRIFTNAAVGSTGLTIYSNFIRYRPKAVASFAGRAWYGGLPSGSESGWVMFSQVVNDQSKLGFCYQQNDPTSEVLSDVMDDDGGVIVIPEVGEIVALRGSSNALIVFATNGIWTIVGGDNGFRATSYIVTKITNVGCLSASSIVEIEDTWIYWSNTGIYSLKLGSIGEGAITNLSDVKIKTYYADIPILSRIYASGTYDPIRKKVEWCYASDDTSPFFKNKSICLDVALQSWYTYTFASGVGQPRIIAPFTPTQASENDQIIDVVANGDDVYVSTDLVQITVDITEGVESYTKYVVLAPTSTTYSLTFADLNNTSFSDWGSTEQEAYMVLGYDMGNSGPARQKTASYINVFMKRTETSIDGSGIVLNPSGCFLQTRWDFTDNSYPGKWSDTYQVYRQLRPYFVSFPSTFDDGYPLVFTKNKLRGRGKAVQLKFSSDAGKDMKLVGWSLIFISNTNV